MSAQPLQPETNPPSPKPVILGDFQLVRRVGHGAMGHVYLATQLSLGRKVAVKVLYRNIAANKVFLRRFTREARLMARLSHPHVVQCYSFGKSHGRYYLAMEFVDGHTALEWMLRKGKFRVGDALHVALAVAHALEYLHGFNLVHRDVKPDNVLIGRDGTIKLADLGLTRKIADDMALTQTGHGAGTPVYMPPEQARNAKYADHRSDLYALGCMLYQLLTAELPFLGDGVLEIIMAKMEGRYTPARRHNPEVPAQLDQIIARLLAPHPEDRYQTTLELIHDLSRLNLTHPFLSFLPPPSAADTHHSLPRLTWPELAAVPEAAPSRWYVIHRKGNGRWVNQEMTTGQVAEAITTDEDFAQTAQVSETAMGEYRSPEFVSAFRTIFASRARKSTAEQEAAFLAEYMEQVRAADRKRQGWIRRILRFFW